MLMTVRMSRLLCRPMALALCLVAPVLAAVALPTAAAADGGLVPPARAGAPTAIDGIVAGRYYESFRLKDCTDATSCRIVFAKVPKDRVLRMTDINCWLYIFWDADNPVIVQLEQGPKSAAIPKAAFQVAPITAGATARAYVLNAQTSAFIEPNRAPTILLDPSSEALERLGGQCTVTGELLRP
jgi:hypothetical protein